MKFAQTQPQIQPQIQQPVADPNIAPYLLWKDIGIVGFVVVSLAIALGKWLPSHLDERWKLRQKEIEAQIVAKQKALEAEASRDEHDRKMMAEVTNTLLAKELQRSQELLENLSETQQRIAETQGIQQKQFEAISRGFEQSTQNQARTIEVLKEILEALSK
jgi:hypothetical protein